MNHYHENTQLLFWCNVSIYSVFFLQHSRRKLLAVRYFHILPWGLLIVLSYYKRKNGKTSLYIFKKMLVSQNIMIRMKGGVHASHTHLFCFFKYVIIDKSFTQAKTNCSSTSPVLEILIEVDDGLLFCSLITID